MSFDLSAMSMPALLSLRVDELEHLFYDGHISCQCAQHAAQSRGGYVTNATYKLAEGT